MALIGSYERMRISQYENENERMRISQYVIKDIVILLHINENERMRISQYIYDGNIFQQKGKIYEYFHSLFCSELL